MIALGIARDDGRRLAFVVRMRYSWGGARSLHTGTQGSNLTRIIIQIITFALRCLKSRNAN